MLFGILYNSIPFLDQAIDSKFVRTSRNVLRSLLVRDMLPRLIDATLCPAGPEATDLQLGEDVDLDASYVSIVCYNLLHHMFIVLL